MGSELMNEENMCGTGKSVLISLSGIAEAKNVLGPATPDENGEHSHEYNFSPSSSPTPTPTPNFGELETPKETLFDSFAPASDKFLLAPHHRKYREESRNLVVRRLDFTTAEFRNASTTCSDEEERLFEIVYSTIVEAILAEAAAPAPTPTPGTPPLLTGVADTCPAAPIKLARKQRCIDKEICKKLEF